MVGPVRAAGVVVTFDPSTIRTFEVQLAGWNKSDSQGKPPKVVFILQSDDDVDWFARFTVAKGQGKAHVAGQLFDLAIQLSEQDDQHKEGARPPEEVEEAHTPEPKPTKPHKGPYGEEAKALHISGFFRAPPVWPLLGTDEDYHAWLRRRRCRVCGGQDYAEVYQGEQGVLICDVAHVRRSGTADDPQASGTAHKGAYSAVSLCHAHHLLQHRSESEAFLAALEKRNKSDDGGAATLAYRAREWFDLQALRQLEEWGHRQLIEVLGHDPEMESLSAIHPKEIADWAVANDVAVLLPALVRGYLAEDE